MGNASDRDLATSDKYEKAIKEFNYLQEAQDPQLHHIKVYELKSDPYYRIFQATRLAHSDDEFSAIAKHFKTRKEYQNENLVKLFFVQSSTNTNMCSESSQVVLLGEYFNRTLEQENKEMIQNHQTFNESYIWLLTLQIVNACAFLESKGKYHGDLRAQNILKDLEGSVKLIEYSLIPGSYNQYAKAFSEDELMYLSPELLEHLRNKNPRPDVDYSKSDVFTLGLTLLELAFQQSSAGCYDWHNKQLNQDTVDQRVAALPQLGYSKVFHNLIAGMLIDEESRPNFADLEEVLDQFKDQIIGYQPFYNKGVQSQSGQARTPINLTSSIGTANFATNNSIIAPQPVQRIPSNQPIQQSQYVSQSRQQPPPQVRQQYGQAPQNYQSTSQYKQPPPY